MNEEIAKLQNDITLLKTQLAIALKALIKLKLHGYGPSYIANEALSEIEKLGG